MIRLSLDTIRVLNEFGDRSAGFLLDGWELEQKINIKFPAHWGWHFGANGFGMLDSGWQTDFEK